MSRVSGSLFLILATTACVDAVDVEEVDEVGAAEQAALVCNPEEPPPPRPQSGPCVYEIRLDSVENIAGQGITEGAMEMNVLASIDGQSFSWPGAMPATATFVPETETALGHGSDVVSIVVPAGTQRNVQVCATFTEVDDGGANGDDDVGTDCATVTLRAPRLPSGAVVCPSSGDVPVASDLCGDNQCNGRFRGTFEVMVADADGDGVENADDFTPEVCDEELKGQLGRASLIWFHMGDGPVTTFFQSMGTDLRKAMDGYDFTVLIIDPSYAGPFLVDATAIKDADLVLSPYEANLYLGMQEITERGYDMDVWVFSHGSQDEHDDGRVVTYFSSLDKNECVTEGAGVGEETCWNYVDDDGDGLEDEVDGVYDHEIVQNLDPARIGTDLVPIRMAYSIACYNEGMNWAWYDVGAKVVSGTLRINFYPVFYGGFADAWNTGSSYAASVAGSDDPADRLAVEAYMEGEGLLFDCDDFEDGSEELLSVLGLNPCAEDFFVDSDGTGPDEAVFDIGVEHYDPAQSGLANMDRDSARFITGDGTIRKFFPPTLTW